MATRRSVSLPIGAKDAAEEMEQDGEATSTEDALKQFIAAGMQEYGYDGSGPSNTYLRWFTHRLSLALVWVGIAWLAVTFTYPVEARLPAIGAFSAAFGVYSIDRVLEKREPDVSRRIAMWVSGEEA
jgi:hypothetical protein